jgi:hypothetical protein
LPAASLAVILKGTHGQQQSVKIAAELGHRRSIPAEPSARTRLPAGRRAGRSTLQSGVELGEAVGRLSECLIEVPRVGQHGHHQRLDHGEPTLPPLLVAAQRV